MGFSSSILSLDADRARDAAKEEEPDAAVDPTTRDAPDNNDKANGQVSRDDTVRQERWQI